MKKPVRISNMLRESGCDWIAHPTRAGKARTKRSFVICVHFNKWVAPACLLEVGLITRRLAIVSLVQDFQLCDKYIWVP